MERKNQNIDFYSHITAPVCSVPELRNAFETGATEVYCGVIPPSIGKLFGYDDMVTRRQGQVANVCSLETLKELATESKRLHLPISLALNCHYSRSMLPHIVNLAILWAEYSGQAIIVSDLALLVALKEIKLPLRYHLSIIAGVFNSSAISFFTELGISRVVLPRAVRLSEVSNLTAAHPGIDFEALVLHDRCPFIDGLCGFYHGTPSIHDNKTSDPWSIPETESEKCVYEANPSYSGHGCDIVLQSQRKRFIHIETENSSLLPECAACQLRTLFDGGVRYFKIAGRGLYPDAKKKSIAFIRKAIELHNFEKCGNHVKKRITEAYHTMFGLQCNKCLCYYRE